MTPVLEQGWHRQYGLRDASHHRLHSHEAETVLRLSIMNFPGPASPLICMIVQMWCIEKGNWEWWWWGAAHGAPAVIPQAQ